MLGEPLCVPPSTSRYPFSSVLSSVALLLVFPFLTNLVHCTPVLVSMTARWSQTPLLLETAQFLARDKSHRATFWAYVDATSEIDFSNSSYQETYQWVSQVTSSLDDRVKESLEMALAVRFASPAIAMYQQMSSSYVESKDCLAFAVVKSTVSCDPMTLKSLIESKANEDYKFDSAVFDFDHLYPSKLTSESSVPVLLYANLGTKSFSAFHKELTKLSNEGKVKYYLRFFVKDSTHTTPVQLSGYGVELAIKSTEYKAIDSSKDTGSSQVEALEDHAVIKGFDFKKLKENNPDLKENLNQFQFHLIQESEGLKPLKVWELSDLSFQTVQRVKENEEPFEALVALKDYSQNFPVHANEFSKIKVSRALRDDVISIQNVLENVVNEGTSLMLINGIQVDVETLDPFALVDLLYSESKLITSLYNFGLPLEYTQHLLNLNIGVQSEDEYAVDIRDISVKYINDLENDERYAKWPRSLQYLLQPTFPGSLRRLARNIHHSVFIVDPLNLNSGPYFSTAHYFVTQNIPTRVGIVFVQRPESALSVVLSRVIGFFLSEEMELECVAFLKALYAAAKNFEGEITEDLIETKFNEKFDQQDFDEIIGNSEYDEVGLSGKEFYEKSGLGDLPVVLYNGKPISVSHVNHLDDLMIGEIYSGTFFWQKAVWEAEVHERTDLLEYAMSQNHVMPRLNDRVLSKDVSRFLDFAKYEPSASFTSLNQAQMTEYISDKLLYVAKKNPEFDKGVTLWVAANFEESKSRELAYQALKYLKKSESMRIAFLFNHEKGKGSVISDAILATLLTQNNLDAKLFITKLVKEEHVEDLKSGVKTLKELEVTGMNSKEFHAAFENKQKLNEIYEKHAEFCKHVLNADSSEQVLIANGKVIGPFTGSEVFGFDDFELVDKYIHVLSAKAITRSLKSMTKLNLAGNKLSDLIMKITSSLLKNAADSERVEIPAGVFTDRPAVVHIPARKPSEPFHRIYVAIDPLSRSAQKVTPILEQVHKVVNAEVSLFMNCVRKWSEMPQNSFYRYVLPSELEFESNGQISNSKLTAKFAGLPKATLLTMNMQTPESWLVEAVKTPYDLDNILLKDLNVDSVHVSYELAHVLLEGHCYEKQSGQPPRGLQFTLGTSRNPEMYDTIVMANLGYFQLKANPGSWLLRLREGLSKEIYEIASTKGTSTPEGSTDIIVSMRSFTNKFIHVFVSKKPGMQNKDVLGEADSEKEVKGGGIWDTVKTSLFGEKDSEGGASRDCETENCEAKSKESEVLNIFSVASGHLYERFMRVMMISVLKNTNSPVKFWFLKNYLSPSFKDSVDTMKKHYEFEYELVEYKWPRWLNQQTDKQRIIWGYKILFLDVLFPLSVKKIIFVDADQIVRADLTELRDMDLDGAPYGYTPFCDDKKEMEGFRFWKSGYWASHLAGRKYHISALYVIDLQKFRKIAAGDRLRGQYQGLSQDPNSLANLDQDLPNNMIHQVRIKSLPIEWLWCETWCSDDSLKRAKTIDLCNNPLTKEPKLDRAMRIVPEWKEYDKEVRNILSKSAAQFDQPVVDKKGHSKVEL